MSLHYTDNVAGTSLGDEALRNLYKRDSEMDYQVSQTRKISEAYRNPAGYYLLKADALDNVAGEAADIYKDQYKKLIALKVPSAAAHARALKLANDYALLLKADIETQFPSDLNNLSLQMSYNQGGAQIAGFVRPSTRVPGAPASSQPSLEEVAGSAPRRRTKARK